MDCEHEKRAAAYHESSHAVIAALLGATLSSVSITCDHGTWVGSAMSSWGEGSGSRRKEKIFKSAVAGPLGQVKFRALIEWNQVTFDLNDRMEDVLRVIRESELTPDSRVAFCFVGTTGSKHTLEVRDLNDLGDFERLQSLTTEFDDITLLRFLDQTRSQLDSQLIWKAIEHVAEDLVQREQVTEEGILGIIARYGCAECGAPSRP